MSTFPAVLKSKDKSPYQMRFPNKGTTDNQQFGGKLILGRDDEGNLGFKNQIRSEEEYREIEAVRQRNKSVALRFEREVFVYENEDGSRYKDPERKATKGG